MKVLIVGNLTIDRLGRSRRLGGPGYYGGIALTQLDGVKVYLYTGVNRELKELIEEFVEPYGIKVVGEACSEVPTFSIWSDGLRRSLKLGSRGCVLRGLSEVVSEVKPDAVIISPVFREVTSGDLRSVKKSVRLLSVDVQGFVRRVDSFGNVYNTWSREADQVTSLADFIHADIFIETPYRNASMNFTYFMRKGLGKATALTAGKKGGFLIHGTNVYRFPALRVRLVSDVGAGDIFTAVTTYYLLKGDSPLNAVLKGATAAGLKVGRGALPWFTEAEILGTYTKLKAGTIKLTHLPSLGDLPAT